MVVVVVVVVVAAAAAAAALVVAIQFSFFQALVYLQVAISL